MSEHTPQPLSGIRVLELSSIIAGPMAARILGDFGADVIKVEVPGQGDELRRWGTMLETNAGPISAWWFSMARNKRLITLNLREPEGQALALKLIAQSDIVVENFRPGRLEAWNLGYERMQEVNPGVILVRMSGYGQTGPYSQYAGYGNIGESMGGLRYITGYPDRPPVRIGVSLGDALAANQAALGTMMALQARQHTGRGQVVDVAITEAVFAMTEAMLTEYAHIGVVRERKGNILSQTAPSNIYQTQDKRWLAIGGNGDNVFPRFMQCLGRPELADDIRFCDNQSRIAHNSELDQIIGEWTQQHTLEAAKAILDKAGIPAGPVMSIADIAADPQYQARNMIVRVPDERLAEKEVVLPGIVPRLTETPGTIQHSGGDLGADNFTIYHDLLGIDESEIQHLQAKGVI
ncbi:MAG: CoA transferase [Ktedonobacteraceae bacterium]|nr:CoA transferase [Ktedonobacteraceae bacterium]